MSSARVLLLLPLPPQNTTYLHVKIALRPSVRSAIHLIHKSHHPGETCVLEIAVPITRIRETTEAYGDLFKRTNSLVSNIYHLISTTCKKLNVQHGDLDVRILLVQDDSSLDDEYISQLGVLDYPALATSDRDWTHVFAVESEQGDETFRKFSAIARQHGAHRDALFARVQRVASGMQVYIPISSALISNATEVDPDTRMITMPKKGEMVLPHCHIIVVISGNIEDQYRDKYLLTMALFAMRKKVEHNSGSKTNRIGQASRISIVVSKGMLDDGLKVRVGGFVAAAINEKLAQHEDDDGRQLSFSTYEEMRKECVFKAPSMLVVSDAYTSIAEEWAAQGSPSIVLGSTAPVDELDN
ncbi:hypothetical protein RRF57_000595 [Xylaria bambusicola]|uniref:Uncharacterized protein n=1 Tax=Xylaria bambusicola TaxID=326684 RepID=A0AAN7UA19_9PEZI